MNYKIDIDRENKLIRYKHWGEIPVHEIGKAWEEFLRMEEFTQQKFNLLSDYRDGKFIGSITEVNHIVGILLQLKPILEGKKQALILSSPKDTALSYLFENKVNQEVGFIVQVFTTEKGAIEWLLE
jgi:hypothetical protein